MASQAKGEDAQPAPDSQQKTSSPTSWIGWLVGRDSKPKEHAETYPYQAKGEAAQPAPEDAQPAPEDAQPATDSQRTVHHPTTWMGKLVDKYQQTKLHAETYPYVWASYIFVYGTLYGWVIYKFTKLRRHENKLLELQEKLRLEILAEHAEAAAQTEIEAAAAKAKSAVLATSKAESSAATLKADKAPQDATPKPME